MNLTPVQIANQYRRCGMTPPAELIRGTAVRDGMVTEEDAFGAPAPPAPRGMNGLERKYAEHLDLQKRLGVVTWWAYEPMRLRLADGAFFKPDYLVQLAANLRIRVVEIKGSFFREAAKVRIKVAADRFPIFDFVVVRKVGGEWQEERIG